MIGFQRMHVTDDEVNAYVDGALAPRDAATVAGILGRNPEQAAEVASFRAQNDALRALYGDIANEPVPQGMRDMVEAARRRMVLTRERREQYLLDA